MEIWGHQTWNYQGPLVSSVCLLASFSIFSYYFEILLRLFPLSCLVLSLRCVITLSPQYVPPVVGHIVCLSLPPVPHVLSSKWAVQRLFPVSLLVFHPCSRFRLLSLPYPWLYPCLVLNSVLNLSSKPMIDLETPPLWLYYCIVRTTDPIDTFCHLALPLYGLCKHQ